MTKRKGFTLIELLVVIAIIGILSTIAVIALQSARAKSRDAKRVADVKQLMTAYEMYVGDGNGYPVLGAAGTPPAAGSYMATVPNSPTPQDGTCSADNNSYTYQSITGAGAACGLAPCAGYLIEFCLGAQTGDYVAGLHCVTPAGGITNLACAWGV